MDLIVIAVILLIALLATAWWMRKSVLDAVNRPRDDQAMILLQNQVNELGARVDARLDKASAVIHGVSSQLGQLGEASKRIFDLGKDISSLQEILRAPKLRGGLGELFLGDLLAQILPPDHYQMQFAFKGGEAVDAVIRLKTGLVPVDAKFPLENFRRIAQEGSDDERAAARKIFVRDVKKHIDAIAQKYIRTDEGTFDFALMYIPAENVYYEIILRDEGSGSEMALFNYALAKRVIPVSPNSFYAYLQTILLGLKGMRVEESARDMINHIARLKKEFERFDEAFRLIGTHLDRSAKQYREAEGRLGKIGDKMEQIDGLAQTPQALDAHRDS